MKNEQRTFEITEIRAENEEKREISGYAAVFNKEITIKTFFGSFTESIDKGAFTRSIKEGGVAALWNHNTDLVIGSQENKTLSLDEDEKGLRFSLQLPDTTTGIDAYKLIRGGFVKGMSFGFQVKRHRWEDEDSDVPKRVLEDVNLFEVSPTKFPAYKQTTVSARSDDEIFEEYQKIREKQKLEKKHSPEFVQKKLIFFSHSSHLLNQKIRSMQS